MDGDGYQHVFDLTFLVPLENFCMGRKHGKAVPVGFSQQELCICGTKETNLPFVNGVVFGDGRYGEMKQDFEYKGSRDFALERRGCYSDSFW